MMRNAWFMLMWAAHPAMAEPASFEHKDWALRCDNTRTCRAEGYQSQDGGESDPVSMLLTRAAGPGKPVRAELQIYSESDVKNPVRFTVGRFSITWNAGERISFAQPKVPELLREMLKSPAAVVREPGKGRTWTLSSSGLTAVLLKMDEAQGRLDTPGALIRRGKRDEAAVLPALPAPVVVAVKPIPTRAGDALLRKPLLAAIDPRAVGEQCNSPEIDSANASVTRLSERKVLLAVPCSMGAYNSTTLLWMADDRPPYKPALLEANGDFDANTGEVSAAMKGRGVGDCWSHQRWQFDGKDFVRSGSSQTGLCRGFPGGAWDIPDYITR